MATITKEQLIIDLSGNAVAIGLWNALAGIQLDTSVSLTTGYNNFYHLLSDQADATVGDANFGTWTDAQAHRMMLSNIRDYVSNFINDYIAVYP